MTRHLGTSTNAKLLPSFSLKDKGKEAHYQKQARAATVEEATCLWSLEKRADGVHSASHPQYSVDADYTADLPSRTEQSGQR